MNHFFKSSLLLFGFVCIKASEYETLGRNDEEREYFAMQEKIYQGVQALEIPGASRLNVSAALAESVLVDCSKDINQIMRLIKRRMISEKKKHILLYGPAGTGKSTIAQAIAIQSKIPCLLFKAGAISTTYMNSGVQNLSKIFKYAVELAKESGESCVVIMDELGSLVKKQAAQDNPENTILTSFWDSLDTIINSQVIVISTMNNLEDVPSPFVSRTCMIKIPLPTQKEREAVIFFHLQDMKNKYKLQYPEWLTPEFLAEKTQGFSNRDLQEITKEPLISAIIESDENEIMIMPHDFDNAIKKINQGHREAWKCSIKKYLSNPNNILAIVQLGFTAWGHYNQREATNQGRMMMGLQLFIARMQMRQGKQQMNQTQVNHDAQMEQTQKNVDRQYDQTQEMNDWQKDKARCRMCPHR